MTTSAPSPPSDCAADGIAVDAICGGFPCQDISPSPARALASRASAPASGASTPDSFASFDPASCSWRTSQRSLVEDLETFSETWPRSGTMRGGTAYRLPPLAPLTVATGSGLLPTPEASEHQGLAMRSGGRSPRNFTPSSEEPTPLCERSEHSTSAQATPEHSTSDQGEQQ
jgi:hypothetical protein